MTYGRVPSVGLNHVCARSTIFIVDVTRVLRIKQSLFADAGEDELLRSTGSATYDDKFLKRCKKLWIADKYH